MSSFDFDFRPSTYWPTERSDEEAVSRIKGVQRRRAAAAILDDAGHLPADADKNPLFAEKLSEDLRDELGKIHPSLMGGEYLPDLDEDAAEIVSIELDSTLADVISVRAARTGDGIRYSIVDEYDREFEFSPESSREPLTMGQLIELIDGTRGIDEGVTGLTDVFRDLNMLHGGNTPEELAEFVTVKSSFYPELEAYYRAQAQDWLEKVKGNRRSV